MKQTLVPGTVLIAFLLLGGCRGTPGNGDDDDAGQSLDASRPIDASTPGDGMPGGGTRDAGRPSDAGTPIDAGPLPTVDQLFVGGGHTCVLRDGSLRCWGRNNNGQLGYGNITDIGFEDTAGCAGAVDVGGTVTQLAMGAVHTCALLDTGAVRCWGEGRAGKLGYGNEQHLGDDETPASAGDVDVGGTVTQLAAGTWHTCALLDTGAVRCWGDGYQGRLGYGNQNRIGDNETPATAGDVDVGGTVIQIAAGDAHTCALLDTGAVRCWGFGLFGQLGYGNSNNVGDDETPASAGDVNVGGVVTQIATGDAHTCALLDTGAVRCWGLGGKGALGYGNPSFVGKTGPPSAAGDVPVGGLVTQIATGTEVTCARLATGAVRCWGFASSGKLGYGNIEWIGDDETPASAGDVPVGGSVARVVVGGAHTCAWLDTGTIRCWGTNLGGALGYGNGLRTLGDERVPMSRGDVPVDRCVVVPVCEPAACQVDGQEGNDGNGAAETASLIFTAPRVSAGVDRYFFDEVNELFLCQGEEDWYRVPVASLGITRLRFLVRLFHVLSPTDCALCDTGGMSACASHQVTVDVHDATTGALIASETHDRGYVWIQRDDLPVSDLLIRVHGAPEANLPYRLVLDVAQWDPNCQTVECSFPAFCDSHC